MLSNLNPRRSQANGEAARRRTKGDTYTRPLGIDAAKTDADMKAVRAFLGQFYATFYSKASRSSRQKVLEEYEEVAAFAESLVPKVASEEEFWQRYYFRCDPGQILLEWERHPERGRKVMGEAVTSWFDSKLESARKVLSDFSQDEGNDSGKNGGSIEGASPKKVPNNSTENGQAHASLDARRISNNKKADNPSSESLKGKVSNDSTAKGQTHAPAKPISAAGFNASRTPNDKKADNPSSESAKDKVSNASTENGQVQAAGLNASGTPNGEKTDDPSGEAPAIPRYVPPHRRGKVQVAEEKTASAYDQRREIFNSRTNGGGKGRRPPPPPRGGKDDGTRAAAPKRNARLAPQARPFRPSHAGSHGEEEKKEEDETRTHELESRDTPQKPDAPNAHFADIKTNMEEDTAPSSYQSKATTRFSYLMLSIPVLCCSVFMLALSRREQICGAVRVDRPWWNSVCPEAPPTAMNSYHDQTKERGRKTMGAERSLKKNNQRRAYQPSAEADDFKDGGASSFDGIGNPAGYGSEDGGGLVDSLISSWMQNTDMAQMVGGMEQQFENAVAPSSPSRQERPPQKKKNGLVQFVKRRFGRDRRNDDYALAANDYDYNPAVASRQPQMVVHQHVHHVVHHVVHEYKD